MKQHDTIGGTKIYFGDKGSTLKLAISDMEFDNHIKRKAESKRKTKKPSILHGNKLPIIYEDIDTVFNKYAQEPPEWVVDQMKEDGIVDDEDWGE